MAERYQQTPGRFPSPKGVLMFLLPLPVLFAAIASLARGHLGGLLGNAAGYALFLVGALLLRQGLLSEAEYDRRRVAKAPWPLKTLGGGVIALATTETVNPHTVIYLNRLSDLLFVLSRAANGNGAADVLWTPGKHRNPPEA